MRGLRSVLLAVLAASQLVASQRPRFSKLSVKTESDGPATFLWTETGLGNQTSVTLKLQTTQIDTFYCVVGAAIQGAPIIFGDHFNYASAFQVPVVGGRETSSWYDDTYDNSHPNLVPVCPTGQTRVLACVAYPTPTITDEINAVSKQFPAAVVNVAPALNSQSGIACVIP